MTTNTDTSTDDQTQNHNQTPTTDTPTADTEWVLETLHALTAAPTESDTKPPSAYYTDPSSILNEGRKEGLDTAAIKQAIETARETDAVISYHGALTPADDDAHLLAAIEAEGNSEFPRRTLIGRLTRARQHLRDADDDTEDTTNDN